MPTAPPESILNTHDFLNLQNNNLQSFFVPRNVAIVGASERIGSVGRATFENLLSGGFKGHIFPVNSAHSEILGHKAYPSLKEISDPIDLIVITVPAKAVAEVIRQGIEKSIPAAIVISAGFKETGSEGKKLEDELLRLAQGKMRILGPNCLGLMAPHWCLNATFAQSMAKPGNVAFISQSGALCTAILDWSLQESFGFSGFISTGSMADIGWGDLIDYFGADEATKSIVIYMESIGDARSFMSAAREVSLNKPIIVIKAGRTQAAAKAAASHTGSLTGSDEVLDAAFHRCGVLRVDEISEVFYMADVLGKQPLPKGPRLAILTNAGGPGVLATDALVSGGGSLAPLDEKTLQKLNEFLPAAWSHGNPIDILGDAEPERYAKTLAEIVSSPENDGVLVITTPQGMTNPMKIAQQLIPYAKNNEKPILASWMGGEQVAKASEELNRIGIPSFPFPDAAAKAFNYMWQSQQNLKMLYETPEASLPKGTIVDSEIHSLIIKIKETGREILSEFESKTILEKYGIPTVTTRLALSPDEAAQLAKTLGFPVVLKIHSETITHKSDIGGVILNLQDEQQVQSAFETIKNNVEKKASSKDFLGVTVQPMISMKGYELILGSSVDPQFGPTLLFGAGGELVEVFKDRALALPPLTSTLARQMMQKTKIFKALLGVRGRKPVDLKKLEQVLVRFSELVLNHPEIAELDINPLLVSEDKIIALDARILLHPKGLKKYPIPSIRPYPIQYSGNFKLKSGQELIIRPIRPEDEAKIRAFHGRLSEQTVYSRFLRSFNLSERIQHERLTRICFIDYDREIALVALNKSQDDEQILAVARMKRTPNRRLGNLSLIVEDEMQGKGLGKELVTRLIQIAKDEKLDSLSALMDSKNEAMNSIFKQLGFSVTPESTGFRVLLQLNK